MAKGDSQKLKMAMISGAARALKLKAKNPNATEQQILHEIMKEADLVLENINAV
jgi:hypothetical protein